MLILGILSTSELNSGLGINMDGQDPNSDYVERSNCDAPLETGLTICGTKMMACRETSSSGEIECSSYCSGKLSKYYRNCPNIWPGTIENGSALIGSVFNGSVIVGPFLNRTSFESGQLWIGSVLNLVSFECLISWKRRRSMWNKWSLFAIRQWTTCLLMWFWYMVDYWWWFWWI